MPNEIERISLNISGGGMPATDLSVLNYAPVRRLNEARREVALNRLDELYEAVRNGSVQALRALEDLRDGRTRLYETQTTADFAALTSELMGRRLRAKFMSYPAVFRRYVPVRDTPITDFKNVYSVVVDRSTQSSTFNTVIPEGGSFGYSRFADSNEGYKAQKYIEGYKATFELRKNDDLGGLAQVVPYMVEDQVYVQEYFAASLHCDASGPHASLYTGGRGNIVVMGATTNPDLELDALQAAFEQLGSATDASGRPIYLPQGYVLVVGSKSLETKAYHIKNTIFVDQASGSDTRRSTPYLPDFDIVFNPYIGQIVTSNLATSWWVFPRAVSGMTRTWAEMGFMAGFDTPQVYMKASNVLNLGGGVVSDIGDFDTWAMEYAVATIFGGRRLDSGYQVTVASNGTNS